MKPKPQKLNLCTSNGLGLSPSEYNMDLAVHYGLLLGDIMYCMVQSSKAPWRTGPLETFRLTFSLLPGPGLGFQGPLTLES